jgi:hypothetical protein
MMEGLLACQDEMTEARQKEVKAMAELNLEMM